METTTITTTDTSAASAAITQTPVPGTASATGATSGGTPTANTQTQTAIPAAGATPAGSADWSSGFNPELKGYVDQKGFKDPAQVAESYRNLEKLLGAPKEQIVKLPGADGKPEEWDQVWNRLGKPDKADGYQIEAPKDAPAADPAFTEWAKSAALKANMTNEQFKTLMGEWNNLSVGENQKAVAAQQAKFTQDVDAVKAEWGNAYDQKMTMGKTAAKEFGLTEEMINGIAQVAGYKNTMKLFADIGAKMGEAQFVSGAQVERQMTTSDALAQIAVRKSDPAYMARYAAKNSVEYAEFSKLMAAAYPGQTSIG